jgi:hypothetical protein
MLVIQATSCRTFQIWIYLYKNGYTFLFIFSPIPSLAISLVYLKDSKSNPTLNLEALHRICTTSRSLLRIKVVSGSGSSYYRQTAPNIFNDIQYCCTGPISNLVSITCLAFSDDGAYYHRSSKPQGCASRALTLPIKQRFPSHYTITYLALWRAGP